MADDDWAEVEAPGQGPPVTFREPTTVEELLALNEYDRAGKAIDQLLANGELSDYDDELAHSFDIARTIIRRIPDAIASALRAARREENEAAAKLVENAYRCEACGAVFDQIEAPHWDEHCPKARASWGEATHGQIAAAIRARLEPATEEKG